MRRAVCREWYRLVNVTYFGWKYILRHPFDAVMTSHGWPPIKREQVIMRLRGWVLVIEWMPCIETDEELFFVAPWIQYWLKVRGKHAFKKTKDYE